MTEGNQVITREEKVTNQPGEDGALLSIQDLKVWFELRRFGFGHAGFVRAVDDVTFDVKHGEAIAVVGESGCGKSSLMKTILGLYRPTEGKVVFEIPLTFGVVGALIAPQLAAIGAIAALLTEATVVVEKSE